MRDINKYRRVYHLIISPLVFLLFWYIIFDSEFNLISTTSIKYHIILGSSFLFISLVLKGFKNFISVLLIGIIGISTLILVYENNVVFGFAFYALTYSILSADAVYSQTGLLKKILMFTITLFIFSTILNIINDKVISDNPNKLETTDSIESRVATADTSKEDAGISKRISPQEIIPESKTEPLSEFEKNNIKKEVSIFINDWKRAWESRKLKNYKAFYSDDFINTDKNGKENNFAEKMKTAERNFNNNSYIKVNFENVTYEFDDEYPKEVTVKILQEYISSTYSDYGLKTLMIYKGKSTGNKWKIYREKFEIIEKDKQTQRTAVMNKEDETSFWSKLCWGTIIVIVLVMLIAFVRKMLK